MRIVVAGDTGVIGAPLARELRERGHEVVVASRGSGADTITGAGLDAALAGADVTIDVTNPRADDDDAAMAFFDASTRNLLAAGARAGVRHHVVLSIVGADRLTGSGYMRAKVRQEELVAAGPLPYTIVRGTQFFEFVPGIVDAFTSVGEVRLAPVGFQPVAVTDLASILAEIAAAAAVNGTVEDGGPERFRFDELARRFLAARGDPRVVITDPEARYFGAELRDGSLVPGPGARLGTTRFAEWLERTAGSPDR